MRRSRPDAARSSWCRPARWNARRSHRSCGPGRSRRSGPAPTASVYVDDLLTIGEQSVGDVSPDALATLDRPRPLRVTPAEGEHRFAPRRAGGEPTAAENRLVASHHLDRGRALVGSMPITTAARSALIPFSDHSNQQGCRAGRAPLLRAAQSPLEPFPAQGRRPARAGQMRATRPAWAAEMRATNRAPRSSLARHRS